MDSMVGGNVKVDFLALTSSRDEIWGTVEVEDISKQLSLRLARTQNKDSLHPFPLWSSVFCNRSNLQVESASKSFIFFVMQWVDEKQQQKGLAQNCPSWSLE